MDNRTAQFLPLGYQRLRLLGCLGGDSPTMPGYFNPDPDMDIFEAFHHYVASMSQKWAAETDRITISLLAAAHVFSQVTWLRLKPLSINFLLMQTS